MEIEKNKLNWKKTENNNKMCKENTSNSYEMNRVCHLKIKILKIGSSICKAMMIVQQNMLLVKYEEKKKLHSVY